MPTDLTNPDVVKIFGNNLDTCLRLIGSRPESLALRCKTSLDLISGLKQGLGELDEQLVLIVCKDIGVSREQILKEHRSGAETIRQFEAIFRAKGRITASNLIGSNEARGEDTMPPQHELPPGKLNDPMWRQNFGLNVRICLQHMEKTAMSLAIRTEMSESQVEQIFVGKLSLSNDDIEAIRLEVGLNTNDLIMDYIDNNRRNDELLAKLKTAGRIKPPKPTVEVEVEVEVEPVPPPALEVPAAAVGEETVREEPAVEPAIPAEMPQTMEMTTMTNILDVTWDDNDVTSTAGDRTFNLRDKEYRKVIGGRILALKKEKSPDVGWSEILTKSHIITRAANWIHNVKYGLAAITGTEIEAFAEFFGVSALSLLTGAFETVEAAPMEHDLTWSKDGTTATDISTGHVFDLSDGQLSSEVARRVRLLCLTKTTVEQMLDVCCIDETTTWFEAVQHGTRNLAEDHIEGFAEFFSVTDFALLSGEGLDLPEEDADEGDSVKVANVLQPVVPAAELVAQQPEVVASAEEASGGGTDDRHTAADTESGQLFLNLGEDVQRVAAFQEHFRQRLLSAEFELADRITPRSFLEATQALLVDWCSVYHTMTKDGAETLKQVTAIAERFDADDTSLNTHIFTHVLSMALKQR